MTELQKGILQSAQWEAFRERADIMEVDGKLAHNAAIIEALKIYYPADYAEMVQAAKEAGLDPETEILAYIESMIETDRELRKKLETLRNKKHREGIDALTYFINFGIPLIGAYENKAMIGKEEPENFTTDMNEINALREGKGNRHGKGKGYTVNRFYFIPADNGLFCLDIDAKEGKEDGLKELFKIFDRDTLPAALADIEGVFPCYVKTPNNGYHLYFKYKGPPIKNAALFPGIETKHGKPGLTAPGSINAEGKPYILYGAIENAPPLYGIIIDKIQKRDRKPEPIPQRMAADKRSTFKKPFEGQTPWAKIIDWTDQEGRGKEGRDAYAFHLAFKAATHNWNRSDTEAAMDTMTWNFDASFTKKQLSKCIKSAYNNAGVKA